MASISPGNHLQQLRQPDQQIQPVLHKNSAELAMFVPKFMVRWRLPPQLSHRAAAYTMPLKATTPLVRRYEILATEPFLYTPPTMVREFSAGGVVLRRMAGAWYIAVIEPQHEATRETLPEPATATTVPSTSRRKKRSRKVVLALPKGLVDDGEQPADAALREVREETGVIDEISPDMRIEVRQALWLPLDEAPIKLAYSGERQVVRRAQQYIESHPEV
jgi:hypothetical protein